MEESSAKDRPQNLEIPVPNRVPGGLNLALQAARPRIGGSQTAGGGPVWSRYWSLRPGLLVYQYQSWDLGDNVG